MCDIYQVDFLITVARRTFSFLVLAFIFYAAFMRRAKWKKLKHVHKVPSNKITTGLKC